MGRTVGARYIIKCAVGQVLESSSDTRGRVVLHRRYVDNFRHFVSHNACHVRACFPLTKKITIAIDTWFVTSTAREGLLDTHDSNPWWQQRLVAADVHFVLIPVIDEDVTCGNAHESN